ncbi:nuclear transport factor 2 family protein [Robiginitalea sp.]|uniref:nuclear transport factor 2 family protein n=1 Tax=Robiginitalea sp. TaxID=1902411 RepID=UPI003C753239
MNRLLTLAFILFFTSLQAQEDQKKAIENILDSWHKAAANADFNAYFELMSEGSVFVGTDAAEHWNKQEFMSFSKPYFDQGKAWDFKAVERYVFIDKTGEIAWFDELLDTWMQLCRGSGVLVREGGEWKIAHYVLSMTVPNENVEGAVALKKERDSVLLKSLLSKRTH